MVKVITLIYQDGDHYHFDAHYWAAKMIVQHTHKAQLWWTITQPHMYIHVTVTVCTCLCCDSGLSTISELRVNTIEKSNQLESQKGFHNYIKFDCSDTALLKLSIPSLHNVTQKTDQIYHLNRYYFQVLTRTPFMVVAGSINPARIIPQCCMHN